MGIALRSICFKAEQQFHYFLDEMFRKTIASIKNHIIFKRDQKKNNPTPQTNKKSNAKSVTIQKGFPDSV